jgi:hypothetical protein
VTVKTTVTAGVLTGKSELTITSVAGLRDILYGAEFRDSDGETWRRLGGDMVAQDEVRGVFHLDDLGDATMVMLCAPFRVAAAAALDVPPAADAPKWLHAAKHDGSYIAAAAVNPGDYMFEYYETGSFWLPVLNVVVADGRAAITYGRGSGATVSPAADRTIRVLRKADAVALHASRRSLVAAVSS